MPELILEIVEGDEAGRQAALTGPIEIGRDASSSFALQDDQMSRRHARVSAQGDLALVEDLGSTNGTYVNGQQIEGPRAVRPGDQIRVGLTVLELRTAQDVQSQPSAVLPVPQVTALSQGILEPAPDAPEPAAAAAPGPAAAAEPGSAPPGSRSRKPRRASCLRRWPTTSRPATTTGRLAAWSTPRSSTRRISRCSGCSPRRGSRCCSSSG